jgi:ABC-type amino acid transport substrate-binding protein
MLRKLLALWLIMLSVIVPACIPSTETPEVVSYAEDTTMGEIQAAGTLRVAIDPRLPPFAGPGAGFVNSYARQLADRLGVELDLIPMTSREIVSRVNSGEADVGFPIVPMSEEVARRNEFTDPYWIAHQRVITTDRSVTQASDLGGERVCSFAMDGFDVSVTEVAAGALIAPVEEPGSCRRPLRLGRAQAATGSDAYLISLASSIRRARIVGDQLSSYGYSAQVTQDATDMQAFVNTVLAEAKADGMWLEWYDDHLGDYAGIEDPRAPDLTLSEVATIYPRSLEG